MGRRRRGKIHRINPPTPTIVKVAGIIPPERALVAVQQELSITETLRGTPIPVPDKGGVQIIVNGKPMILTREQLYSADSPLAKQQEQIAPVPVPKPEPPPLPPFPTSPKIVDNPPKVFSLVALTEGTIEDVPSSPSPYYLAVKEGLFLYRNGLIGESLTPLKEVPEKFALKTIGPRNKGLFWWKAPIIPAEICAQIVHFFRRIYDYQKTEAEVLLLLNYETMEWKVWVPTQNVSHGGVHSVYEPADIPEGYIVVGTMHSHCNFSAYHSSTDTGDASSFDGIHLTIGHLKDEQPEVDAMVMINKVMFDYSKNIPLVADFSNLEAAEAPGLWDQFVEDTVEKLKPVGHELFVKYPRYVAPTPYQHQYRPPNTYYQPPIPWQQRDHAKPWSPTNSFLRYDPETQKYARHVWNQEKQRYEKEEEAPPVQRYAPTGRFTIPDDANMDPVEKAMWEDYFNSKEYNSERKRDSEHLVVPSFFRNLADDSDDDILYRGGMLDKELALDIIDALDQSLAAALMNSQVLLDDDLMEVTAPEALTDRFWKDMYMRKLVDVATVLRAMGNEVNFTVTPKPKKG